MAAGEVARSAERAFNKPAGVGLTGDLEDSDGVAYRCDASFGSSAAARPNAVKQDLSARASALGPAIALLAEGDEARDREPADPLPQLNRQLNLLGAHQRLPSSSGRVGLPNT